MQGTKWYRTTIGEKYGAWGFADGASDINLLYVDGLDSDGDKRISWSTNVGGNGGYRCGATTNLRLSPDWERVFYHAD